MEMAFAGAARAFAALLFFGSSVPTLAQDAPPPDAPQPIDASDAVPDGADGYRPSLIDGALGATGDLAEDEVPRSTLVNPTPSLPRWFAMKKRFEDRTGISFGGSYGVLVQGFSQSRFAEDIAFGHKFTFNASAALANKGKPNALTFDMVIEDRRPLGTDFAPLQAGFLAGSGVPTAATWGNFDLGITQAYIRQTTANGRFQYTIGKIFAPNFVNAYPFFDDNRQFLSLAFSTSPTIAVPLRGAGFVVAAYPGAGNLYVKGGMFTANSDDTGWTVGDFFGRDEHFYFVEVGQTSFARRFMPIHARGPMDRNNMHVTVWYRDGLIPRPDRPTDIIDPRRRDESAYGVAFNINQMAGDSLMWFLRGGVGRGGFAKANITGGIGIRPKRATSDLFGIGLGWSDPEDFGLPEAIPILREPPSQWTSEVFYRLHITPNLALTPVFQFLVNPSLDPDSNTLSVFSVRTRIAF